jgi:hypothetical protein
MLLPLLLPLHPTRPRQDHTGVPSTLSFQQQELRRQPRRRLQQQQWVRLLRRQMKQIAGGLVLGWDLLHLVRLEGTGMHLLLQRRQQQWQLPKRTTAQRREEAAVVVVVGL